MVGCGVALREGARTTTGKRCKEMLGVRPRRENLLLKVNMAAMLRELPTVHWRARTGGLAFVVEV